MQDIKTVPVNVIKGVSVAREKLFAKLGIYSVYDLLYYFPRSYENRGNVRQIIECSDGERVSLILEIAAPLKSARIKSHATGKMITIQHVTAFDETGSIKLTFFNREFLKNTFITGTKFRFYGVLTRTHNGIVMNSPSFELYSENAVLPAFVPVYPLTSGINHKLIASCVKYSLEHFKDSICETLDDSIIKENKFMSLYDALTQIHYPENEQKLESARRRLAFDELYQFYIKTIQLGKNARIGKAYRIKYPDMKSFVAGLPFSLTVAQKRAIHDILRDISQRDKPEPDFKSKRPEYITPSRRLIQGDVGSGKTIVACAAIYAAAKSGYQSALMAPTGILAKQHFEEMTKTLSKYGIKCVLLTGDMRVTEKRKAIVEIANGTADVVIGTHALIEENITFFNLALAITDEQHRFGVMQRKALENKSVNSNLKPHVVVMSATPIPRTLAMIIYCDLDISIIDQMPKGRKPVETYSVGEDKRNRVYKFINGFVELGKQAYIVCPLAELNEDADIVADNELKSAKEYSEFLKATSLSSAKVEYIHGKMNQAQKDDIMSRFSAGEFDILVSTTVIEVGVNVPNAVVMLIENSERFGLSQLHQLRGRVGRGSDKAYCILMSPLVGKAGPDSDFMKRITTICKNNSGFVIAEKDLELRGPGEFFGKRQSGEFRFSVANISADMDLVQLAKAEAEKTLSNNIKDHSQRNGDQTI